MLLLSRHLASFLEQHQLSNRHCVIGLSGGVDSVALLLAAVEFKRQTPDFSFSAIHVNHGISPNSAKWQEFCEALCKQHDVSFVARQVVLVKTPQSSMEQLARDARYNLMAEVMEEGALLLTAHHIVDQAETFLLRLMRRAGLTGLGAMHNHAAYPTELGRTKNLEIARPFLTVSKDDLTTYVKEFGAKWVEDESNLSLSYDRNYIRQKVLPLFNAKWVDYADAIAQSARHLQSDSDLLNHYLDTDLAAMVNAGFSGYAALDLAKLAEQNVKKQSALFRRFCYLVTQNYPSNKVLNEGLKQLINAKEDQQPNVKFGQWLVARHRGFAYLVPDTNFNGLEIEMNGQQKQSIPGNLATRFISIGASQNEQFLIRFGNYKDKLPMASCLGSKSVKQALKDMGCPAWLRPHMPLIYSQGKLVAIGNRYIHPQWQGKLDIQLTPMQQFESLTKYLV